MCTEITKYPRYAQPRPLLDRLKILLAFHPRKHEWGHPEQDEGSHAKGFWGASLEALADRAVGKPVAERPAAFGRARHKL